jgi:hypothetical protein
MCYHGTYTIVSVVNLQSNKYPKVDACIADEIQKLNDAGIVTLGSCCGHGRAGEIIEWENGFGKWRGYVDPPHALIRESSKDLAVQLGYRPFPYYYADGKYYGVMKMYLKTGCITSTECDEWHKRRAEALPKF